MRSHKDNGRVSVNSERSSVARDPSATARLAALSDDEIRAYHRDGQVTPAWRPAASKLAELRSAIDQLIAARPAGETDFIALPHIPGSDPRSLPAARTIFEFATDPDLLDVAEQLIGPDIAFWATAIFGKPAGVGREVPWHQDGRYWPIRPRATVSFWIALDASTPENGCMRVIPGSHLNGMLNHIASDADDLVLNTFVRDERFDESLARDIILKPGQISLHHIDIVHGSKPNRSAMRRAGMTIRYMPTTSIFDRTLPEYQGSKQVSVPWHDRPIWLVRGIDRSGRNDFKIGHDVW
jgi:hypothetical protein